MALTHRIEFSEWVDVDGHWTEVLPAVLPAVGTEREAYVELLLAIADLEHRVRLAAHRAGHDVTKVG